MPAPITSPRVIFFPCVVQPLRLMSSIQPRRIIIFLLLLFSHILPVLGWHQFHAKSHPNSATVVGGNATSHLEHAFAINHHHLHPAMSFVWSLPRRMIHQASNLRWQPTDMAWTSTPSRLRHGPSSTNIDPMIHTGVVCLHRAVRLV
ncbi:hypothetical protein F5883DRAFT_43782 [Diaporthe sp. PMI_573]|nr:hypothetical protein F5883DRAFT_43782 [Diaporthaceae sp. PMI_573]